MDPVDREVYWAVCIHGPSGPFEQLGSYWTRQEAERELRRYRADGWQEAFLARFTSERMDRQPPLRVLKFSTASKGEANGTKRAS